MTKKRKFLTSAIITALVICLVLISAFVLALHPYFYGLNKICVKFDKVYVRCTEFYRYSVESVETDATAFKGEKECPINDDLGNYIIKVRFGDAEVAECFYNKYSPWTTYEIENSDLSFMYSYHADHGFEIFIGSDTPIEKSDIVVKGLQNS